MKTTCICCGKRASHETVRSVGGTWYRCNACNYAWRGVRGYVYSMIANIWWPIKGPKHADVTQRPLSTPTSRSEAFGSRGPGDDGPGVVPASIVSAWLAPGVRALRLAALAAPPDGRGRRSGFQRIAS